MRGPYRISARDRAGLRTSGCRGQRADDNRHDNDGDGQQRRTASHHVRRLIAPAAAALLRSAWSSPFARTRGTWSARRRASARREGRVERQIR